MAVFVGNSAVMPRFYPLPGERQPGARKKISLFSCRRPGIGQVWRMSNTEYATAYTITARRIVPITETSTSLVLRKTETIQLNNGGKIATCVKLDDGRMAWGFGDNDSESESDAVQAAMSI